MLHRAALRTIALLALAGSPVALIAVGITLLAAVKLPVVVTIVAG